MRIKPLLQQLIIIAQAATLICLGIVLSMAITGKVKENEDLFMALGQHGSPSAAAWLVAFALLAKFIMYGLAATAILWWLSQQKKLLLARDFEPTSVIQLGRYKKHLLIAGAVVSVVIALTVYLLSTPTAKKQESGATQPPAVQPTNGNPPAPQASSPLSDWDTPPNATHATPKNGAHK